MRSSKKENNRRAYELELKPLIEVDWDRIRERIRIASDETELRDNLAMSDQLTDDILHNASAVVEEQPRKRMFLNERYKRGREYLIAQIANRTQQNDQLRNFLQEEIAKRMELEDAVLTQNENLDFYRRFTGRANGGHKNGARA